MLSDVKIYTIIMDRLEGRISRDHLDSIKQTQTCIRSKIVHFSLFVQCKKNNVSVRTEV